MTRMGTDEEQQEHHAKAQRIEGKVFRRGISGTLGIREIASARQRTFSLSLPESLISFPLILKKISIIPFCRGNLFALLGALACDSFPLRAIRAHPCYPWFFSSMASRGSLELIPKRGLAPSQHSKTPTKYVASRCLSPFWDRLLVC